MATDAAPYGENVSAGAIVVTGLTKRFRRRGRTDVLAVDDVSFTVAEGTSLGIVGESGSGKSTVARCLLGLTPADGGLVEVLGRPIVPPDRRQLRRWRKDMQVVFQEPFESLNPRVRIGRAIAEPLLLHTELRRDQFETRVHELLELVGLSPSLIERYPHQLSGGQQQRVNIARALATHPRVLVLDEPTSSLDVSVRADILRLLVGLQQEFGLTYLFISHDLTSVRNVCDMVCVMYLGRIVEQGPVDEVLRNPAHPYTRLLLESELSLDPDVRAEVPVAAAEAPAAQRGPGCNFASRCSLRVPECDLMQPPLAPAGEHHSAACIWVGADEHSKTAASIPGA
jgi:oligopeptide/dipeptide ABC transporter ATP-binding protein